MLPAIAALMSPVKSTPPALRRIRRWMIWRSCIHPVFAAQQAGQTRTVTRVVSPTTAFSAGSPSLFGSYGGVARGSGGSLAFFSDPAALPRNTTERAPLCMGGLVGAALPRLSPVKGLGFAAGLAAVYILLARWLFVMAQVWLNMVYPLLALLSVYTVVTVYFYVTEQRQRKLVKETFQHYVAPLVIEEMLQDPQRLKLGGEVKILTVLFSDLEGFTSYSERFAPNEMADMLSEYYNRVTEQVFLHRGTLKEYVSEELMAICVSAL